MANDFLEELLEYLLYCFTFSSDTLLQGHSDFQFLIYDTILPQKKKKQF